MSNPSIFLEIPDVQTPVFHFSFFRTVAAAGEDWDAAAPKNDFFLQRPYLEVLEKNPPLGMRFAYTVFYKNQQPIGVAYCQIKYFKADDNIRDLTSTEKDACFFTALGNWFKKKIAGQVAADVLILGNMLLTGEHGYHFDYQEISQREALEILEKSTTDLLKEMQRAGVKMPVILVKDVDPTQQNRSQFLEEKNFTMFEIQPNMSLDLRWNSFDEYLNSMSTKYRTRAKRAVKKLDGVTKHELGYAEMLRDLPKIYHLYEEIAQNAGFNMVDLNENYLTALRRDVPENFRAFGFFLENEMVAFFTTIKNGDELEAHFLGYEKSLNHDYQLYLNILYDIIRQGIEAGAHRIVFARTALEIKSSVGAVPSDLYCYLRHQNSFANKFAETMLDYLKPVEEWQQRHPFKNDEL